MKTIILPGTISKKKTNKGNQENSHERKQIQATKQWTTKQHTHRPGDYYGRVLRGPVFLFSAPWILLLRVRRKCCINSLCFRCFLLLCEIGYVCYLFTPPLYHTILGERDVLVWIRFVAFSFRLAREISYVCSLCTLSWCFCIGGNFV